MSLDRFKQAQAAVSDGFEDARREMIAGRKTSHWIWYVFPQLGRPGTSPTSQTYAIADGEEAIAYLRDPVLGPRLAELTHIVAGHVAQGAGLVRLMGGTIDALKLVSCLTLFEAAAVRLDAETPSAPRSKAFLFDCVAILAAAERQGFPRCAFTSEKLRRESP